MDHNSTNSLIASVGGKRAAAAFVVHDILRRCGLYQRSQRVDWGRVTRLVFVCSGNICRSPYGHVLASGRGVEVVSFGLHASGGAPADPEAMRCAARRSIDLGAHISTARQAFEVRRGDLLLAMEPGQVREALPIVEQADAQITLLGLWGDRPTAYLPDPYGTSAACFEFVFTLIEQSVAGVMRRLAQAHPGRIVAADAMPMRSAV